MAHTGKRNRRPSEGQKNTNQNIADATAKKRQNKETAERARQKKAKRTDNNAQAAALQDRTNLPSLPPDEQIAVLTARVKSAEAKADELIRKNRKLNKTVRRSQADSNARPSAITPIPKPKGKFNIKNAMGLSGDHTLFTELQAVIHALALEAKIDFDSPWKEQEPGKVAKILRVSEERHSYLCAARFPRHWATSSILQRYINSVRSYKSGKSNPTSGVNRRRQRVTRIGRLEAEASRRRRRIITSPPPEEENEQMDVDSVGGSNLQARDDRSGGRSLSPPREMSADKSDSEEDQDVNVFGAFGAESAGGSSNDDSDDDDDELPVAAD